MASKKHHGLPCPYCARPMNQFDERLRPTRDHVMPQSMGGKAIVICCLTCNGMKANMLPDAWAQYMVDNPGWWLMSLVERRARLRAAREANPTIKLDLRRRQRQGSPPAAPVVVPPHLIYDLSSWPPSAAKDDRIGVAEIPAGAIEAQRDDGEGDRDGD